jgi:hypothetical protein
LRKHGYRVVVDPESFLVTKGNELVDDETAHAERWAEMLVAASTAATHGA